MPQRNVKQKIVNDNLGTLPVSFIGAVLTNPLILQKYWETIRIEEKTSNYSKD
jgi:hypothetical protein